MKNILKTFFKSKGKATEETVVEVKKEEADKFKQKGKPLGGFLIVLFVVFGCPLVAFFLLFLVAVCPFALIGYLASGYNDYRLTKLKILKKVEIKMKPSFMEQALKMNESID